MEGYALGTADENLDPTHWKVLVDEFDEDGEIENLMKLVSDKKDYSERRPWQLDKFMFSRPYHTNRVTLQVE